MGVLKSYFGWLGLVVGEVVALLIIFFFQGVGFPMNPAIFLFPLMFKWGYDAVVRGQQDEEEWKEQPLKNPVVEEELMRRADDGRGVYHKSFGDPAEYWCRLYPRLCHEYPAFFCEVKSNPEPLPEDIGGKYYLFILPQYMTYRPDAVGFVLYDVIEDRVPFGPDWWPSSASLREYVLKKYASNKDFGVNLSDLSKKVTVEI
jgi:hypothetical protein